jgi:hypothetical protein
LADTIAKQNNTTDLTDPSSWEGDTVPGNTDVVLWNDAVTSANNVSLGADWTVGQIKVANSGGNVTIGDHTLTLLGVSGTGTASLNHNTITGNISATGTSTLTLSGSNDTVITGDVVADSGATIGITLVGEGTALHGNFDRCATSVINLTVGSDALLDGSGTLDSLTLENGAVIGYTGLITVTDSITIDGTVTFDLSNLTATGEYNLLDWSGATMDVADANYNFTGAGVEGSFNAEGGKLVFNATAVPEPSTCFLAALGFGVLVFLHLRRRNLRCQNPS